jgi:hypothetical protein
MPEKKRPTAAKPAAFRMAIVSPLGEVTHDNRTAGDTIRFKIYFSGAAGAKKIITITDRLDPSLTEVRTFNGGVYQPHTHTVTWRFEAARGGSVDVEAVVGRVKRITNQATLAYDRTRITTNSVEVAVFAPPEVGWIPLTEGAQRGEVPRVYMKDETSTGTTVRFDIPGVFVYKTSVNGVAYHRFSIPSRAAITDVGQPELPIAGEFLEVPFDVGLSPVVVAAEQKKFTGYNVYPAQPPRIDGPNTEPPFTIDKNIYTANSDFPRAVVTTAAEDIGVIRGHRVAGLKIRPIRYNPVTRVVNISSMMEVKIRFNRPAQIQGVDRRIESPAFEEFVQATVLNYKDQERFARPEGPGGTGGAGHTEETGCDYLIITADALYNSQDPNNALVRLRNWKIRKGYRTQVVGASTLPGGNTADSIRDYIRDAYSRWTRPPTYVLLVGDSDLLGSKAGMHHPEEHDPDSPQPLVQTDLYYATTDGTDYFPDIYIGRLSVDSAAQLNDMVDKILAYEQNPPATPAHADFYNHVAQLGLFADAVEDPVTHVVTNDGQEGRPWIENLESIRQYLAGQGYAVDRIYTTDSGFPAPGSAAPAQYENGTALPNDLQPANYAWTGGTADITNAVNQGRFLVTNRGHGGWNGWARPAFHNGDIAGLTQNGLTPVVFSVTCQTGWFDNETDDDLHGGRPAANESFAERVTRQPQAGAVALVGMTRNSYTGWNDFIIFGLHRAIWPDFVPNPPTTGYPAIPALPPTPVRLLRMGQILNFGKMYMAKAYAAGTYRKLEFELGHLFGDPELPIWTRQPGVFSVDHPAGIGSTGVQEFIVRVTDSGTAAAVQNAVVVLTRNNSIVAMNQTQTDGRARFKLNSIGAGNLDITVTALNFRPYMGTITVSGTGAVLNRIEPGDGPENQVVHVGGQGFQAGEAVQLYFGSQLTPAAPVAGAAGEFGQGASLVNITVPAGHAHEPVNIIAHGVTSGRWAAGVFRVRDVNPVDLWTYDQWDSSTWSVHPGDNPTWDSPDIRLYDTNGNEVASDNLVFGENYTVKTTIHNNANFAAPQANVVYQWRNYGTGGPWEALDTDQINVPASGDETAAVQFSPPSTGHLCIQARVEHMEDITPDNNEGQQNLHVGYSSSPAKFSFLVWNETEEAAPVHLEVRQLFRPGEQEKRRLWATSVTHPNPQILPPGGRGEAWVTIDPKVADARRGEKAEFAVTAFVGSRMVGGVNAIITKQ